MLKQKRKILRISQKEASKILNIHNTYLSLIESRKRTNLKIELVEKICKLYQIEISFFLNWLQEK
ncbi:helix-turn-helix domain-containing protein [Paraclostridium sordellii]|uniref:helix-turn-helix domain-containing protein n=1 Tax=Paraclostridium sordellii TaxID=1505 RepID=UPI0005E79F4C|nr:helix-turn-helix transcriptional regulator [Paeniclostridium sordellii]CEN21277.1 Predicted transcriptional regulator [[Clostridium] sordellii] [Paeniclostridium sordellii]